jgi:hypothetical protein
MCSTDIVRRIRCMALTRLEQMASMNEVYRKENNVAGLQEINRVLKSVPLTS